MNPGGDFSFQHLPNYKFSSIENAELNESLAKWSMSDGLKLQAYSFDKPLRKYNERDFILDFFGCQNVVSTLLRATAARTLAPIGIPADSVQFSEVKCTLTTLHLFDKLKEGKIVRSNGSIVKCMPKYMSGACNDTAISFEMEVADNLRKYILYSDTDADDDDDFEDFGNILTGAEKKEFLFLLFSHFVIGGTLCQYEDNVEPYKEVTKLMYKDLVAVGRAENEAGDDGDKLKVISYVYKIHYVSNECDISGSKNLLIHQQYLNNFFYIVVNPLKQLCFTIYHHA